MPDLPKFRKPPVVETVLSVQFDALTQLRTAHFGILWEKFRNDFPVTEEHPSLPPISETFTKPRHFLPEPTQRWRFTTGIELPRVLFKKKDGAAQVASEMIQVQKDRFVHNWARAKIDAPDYPTYDVNRGEFLEAFEKFCHFVEEQKLGPIVPNLVEVTYVNRISISAGERATDIVRMAFPAFALARSDGFLPPAESIILEQSFPIDGDKGRLQTTLRGPVKLADEPNDILDFRLTARVSSLPEHSLVETLDVAHRWVAKGFKSLTSKEMHRLWEAVDD